MLSVMMMNKMTEITKIIAREAMAECPTAVPQLLLIVAVGQVLAMIVLAALFMIDTMVLHMRGTEVLGMFDTAGRSHTITSILLSSVSKFQSLIVLLIITLFITADHRFGGQELEASQLVKCHFVTASYRIWKNLSSFLYK